MAKTSYGENGGRLARDTLQSIRESGGSDNLQMAAQILRAAMNDPRAAEPGFMIVLADFIAAALDGSTVDLEHLRGDPLAPV